MRGLRQGASLPLDRAGEGDQKGAWRLSLFVCCSCAVAAGLRAHHIPSVVDEVAWLLGIAGWSMVWGLFSWLAYISAEPYVRRWWPEALVSWARLLAGRGRDPLVGRDVLVGIVIGVFSAALLLLQLKTSGQHPVLVLRLNAIESLASPTTFGSLLLAPLFGIIFTVLGLAVLFRSGLVARASAT